VFTELDLTSAEFHADPYPIYARLRAEAPLYLHSDGQLLVARYDDVAGVLKDPDRCSSAPMGGVAPYYDDAGRLSLATGSMIGTDPPQHRLLRGLLRDRYRRHAVAGFEPLAVRTAAELSDALRAEDGFDVVADFSVPLVERVIAQVAGIDEHRFCILAESSRAAVADSDPTRELAKMGTAAAVLTELVRERREEIGEDVISTLVSAHQRGELDLDQTVATSLLITVSGVEKIPALLANALLALAANPDQMELLRNGPELADRALDETLRYDAPVQLLTREVHAEVTVAGQRIEPGRRLGLLLGSANRDERRFPDPSRFWIGRPHRGHLGFGIAHHVCIGEGLARIVARAGLRALACELPRLRVHTTDLPRRRSLITRGPLALPVSLSG
jgi:cytochrome P450